MELNFQKAGHDYCEITRLAPFSCETMRESIVPDSCADIARIVDTTALVYLTGRELAGDGRICASGTVDVSVLYIPEKAEGTAGPRCLRFQLPFQCYGEGPGEGEFQALDIQGELTGIDTRILNPRKVLTRANLRLHPALCRRVERSICTGVEEGEGVQLLREARETRVVAAVREKEFPFTEELPLSPGRGGAEEILDLRAGIRGTDSKLIGSKLVVKGIAAVSVLYRESGGRLSLLQQELPFSQIIDGAGLTEDCECECAYALLNAECRPGGESGEDAYALTLNLLLRARATVWRREEIRFIADLYSTCAELETQSTELELLEDAQRAQRRQNLRELMETGVAVKAVLDSQITCGPASFSGGELKIPAQARCLYLDENDALGCVRRELTVTCPMEEAGEGVECEAEAACRGDIIANILPEGIELRAPLECAVSTAKRRRYLCVSSAAAAEEGADQEERPSLVLRKLGSEETLWSVAKQYRTTSAAILAVNALEEGAAVPTDRMLLIPKAR